MNKHIFNSLACIAVAFTLAGCSRSANTAIPITAQQQVTGTWEAKDVAFAPWTFTLKAEGAKVTGTVRQGGSSETMTTTLTGATPIYDGAIQGSHVSFKCDSPDGGRTITFSGVMAGDTITFTREVKVEPGRFPGMNGIYGASGASHFTAKRVAASTPETAPRPTPAAASPAQAPSAELPVPKISDVARVDRDTPTSQQVTGTWKAKDVAFAPWTFTLKAEGAKVTGR